MCSPNTSGLHIAGLPHYLVETPRIISQTIDEDDWSELREMTPG